MSNRGVRKNVRLDASNIRGESGESGAYSCPGWLRIWEDIPDKT
jgi:hypothetical protein